MVNLDEWLELAPKPAALQMGMRWHVFLSYRSTERAWVLSLYDILAQLGYSVFMDQFVLRSGGNLARSLEENLEASQSAVLVWSIRSEDSDWCKREYDSFLTLQTERNFRFAIARLTGAPLPLFARNAIWEDFTEQRVGPNGTALLRLIYGLHGLALPDRAIRLAAEIDLETKRGLALLSVHADAQDAQAIQLLAQSGGVAWRASPLLPCAAAQALISIRAPDAALSLLNSIETAFPRSIRPRQLRGLALARGGHWKEARAAIGELYALGERDPETMGIHARTWMDAYEATGDRLLLRRSRDLYAEGFELATDNYYLGVNAAAKSVFLDELDAGAELAQRVQAIVGNSHKASDYWHTATCAEVLLMQRKFTQAAGLYAISIAMTPGRVGDHASTCRQARRLLKHLSPSPEHVSEVMGIFRRVVHMSDSASVVELIRTSGQTVVTFCGFSAAGYEDRATVARILGEQLMRFNPSHTTVCAGGTADGIGMIYPIALGRGFRTIGIVSSLAEAEGLTMSDEVEVVYVVKDDTWGGRHGNGLSPTSEAMVDACDEMIGVGGGAIARDELSEARRRGKRVVFVEADMNHAIAVAKAAQSGEPAPTDFRGEAATLFDTTIADKNFTESL
nr:TIR domain-containing protein [uncultured Duganella sp.]